MQSKIKALSLVIILALVISGCDSLSTVRAGFSTVKAGSVLFEDDFSDTGSGWKTWAQGDSIIAYHAGGLRFIINESQYDFWSRPGKWYEDVSMRVTAQLMNGPTDNNFGLICRFQDDGNFYLFLASSDGYAGIVKVAGGTYQMISGPSMQYRHEISQGLAANQLRADCVEKTLRFYINEELVAEASDGDFPAGDIGLLAGTYDVSGVDILFDDFRAEQP